MNVNDKYVSEGSLIWVCVTYSRSVFLVSRCQAWLSTNVGPAANRTNCRKLLSSEQQNFHSGQSRCLEFNIFMNEFEFGRIDKSMH